MQLLTFSNAFVDTIKIHGLLNKSGLKPSVGFEPTYHYFAGSGLTPLSQLGIYLPNKEKLLYLSVFFREF